MRVRGLKPPRGLYTGISLWVAPHAGAWIETLSLASRTMNILSHPMRVRGLKPC